MRSRDGRRVWKANLPAFFQVCIGMSAYIEIREHHLMVEILLNLKVHFFGKYLLEKGSVRNKCVSAGRREWSDLTDHT